MNIYSLKEHLIYINMYTCNSDWHRQKQQAMSILLLLPSNARQCFSDATGKHVWFAHTLVTLNTHGEMQPPTEGLPEGYVPHDLRWTQWFSFTSVALGHFNRKHKTQRNHCKLFNSTVESIKHLKNRNRKMLRPVLRLYYVALTKGWAEPERKARRRQGLVLTPVPQIQRRTWV